MGVPQVLMIGDMDSDWRIEMTDHYAQSAADTGDPVEVIAIAGANHMDVVDAKSGPASTIATVARRLIAP